ncbi:MAG: PEP-CTERM sorting domain-containing protein [Planctomycetes bacterium]|nr:PEP-CTERM sorting domain-containing protein [Planctomycetota bacterium]
MTVYYPAYAYGHVGAGQGAEPTVINLAHDGQISVWFRDDTPPSGTMSFDLKGGRLHVFIGEWQDDDGPGGAPPVYTFYLSAQPLSLAVTTKWQQASIDVFQPSAWTLWVDEGLGKPLGLLMDTPQQWGFALVGASGVPTGLLGVDTFRAVPEPATAALLAAAALLARRRRR